MNPKTNEEIEGLKSREAAEYLGVSRSGLMAWVKQGLLKPIETLGTTKRFDRHHLETFARERGIQLDAYRQQKFKINPHLKRVLVIDDDPLFREFATEALSALENVEIQTAEDGIQGALLAGTFHAHVVLLDIRMPNINGLEFLKMLRQNPETRPLKVIVISAQLNATICDELTSLQVVTWLEKPVRLHHFIQVVEAALED